jgi:Redoxin
MILAAVCAAAGPMGPVRLDLVDLEGRALAPGRAATVLVFISVDCPLSNQSVPTLNALAASYGPKGVRVVGVYCDPNAGAAQFRGHRDAYGIHFACVDDHAGRLVAATGAAYTPEACVLAADGSLVYRGRIDDRVGTDGSQRPHAQRVDVEEAVQALVHGEIPAFREAPGFGCAIPEKVKS